MFQKESTIIYQGNNNVENICGYSIQLFRHILHSTLGTEKVRCFMIISTNNKIISEVNNKGTQIITPDNYVGVFLKL